MSVSTLEKSAFSILFFEEKTLVNMECQGQDKTGHVKEGNF